MFRMSATGRREAPVPRANVERALHPRPGVSGNKARNGGWDGSAAQAIREAAGSETSGGFEVQGEGMLGGGPEGKDREQTARPFGHGLVLPLQKPQQFGIGGKALQPLGRPTADAHHVKGMLDRNGLAGAGRQRGADHPEGQEEDQCSRQRDGYAHAFT